MRAYNKTGPLSVHAIAGAYVVLLGIDMEEAASEGVLGFGIERIEHGHGNSRSWLRALKVFPDVPVEEGMVSTEHHPIQGFFWGDFTTRYGHEYTYRVVAMRGEPGALRASETAEISIATEKEDEGIWRSPPIGGPRSCCVSVALARPVSRNARFHPPSQWPRLGPSRRRL
jgi:hypothetical protein